MVIYNLLCKKKHSFEGWFPSFEDYQKQADGNLISCPICGTTKVDKVPHACAVHVKKEQPAKPAKDAAANTACAAVSGRIQGDAYSGSPLHQAKLRRCRTSICRRGAADSSRQRLKNGRFTVPLPLKKEPSSPKKAFLTRFFRNPIWTANLAGC